jgi:hypothetical protein
MVRNYIRKRQKNDLETVKSALRKVRNGESIRSVAASLKIPFESLRRYQKKYGRDVSNAILLKLLNINVAVENNLLSFLGSATSSWR